MITKAFIRLGAICVLIKYTLALLPISLDYQVLEEQRIGTNIGNIVRDAKLSEVYSPNDLRQLRFRYLSEPSEYFDVELTTGSIVIKKLINREQLCPMENRCDLKLDVAIQPANYFQIVKISVSIIDINDNTPYFQDKHVTFSISESDAAGTTLPLPSAVDMDSPRFGIAGYRLSEGNSAFLLSEDVKMDGTVEVRLVLAEQLDREYQDYHQLQLIAYDGEDKTAVLEISIEVLDANDNPPMFTESTYSVSIKENSPAGLSVLKLQAYDIDAGLYGKVMYKLNPRSAEKFGRLVYLNGTSGILFVAAVIDYEDHRSVVLTVQAYDNEGTRGFLSSECTVIITVIDTNDNTPLITINTLSGTARADVAENLPTGSFVAYVTVQDPDTGNGGLFDCQTIVPYFKLVPLYQNEFQLVSDAIFDREVLDDYAVTITCTDKGVPQLSSTAKLLVKVTDTNDNAPQFDLNMYTAVIPENNFVGAPVVQIHASDLDTSNNSAIQYLLSPDAHQLFTINDTSGLIMAAVSFDREKADSYQIHAIAKDRGVPHRSSWVVVNVSIHDVNDEPPIFTRNRYRFEVAENLNPGVEIGQVVAFDADSVQYNGHQFDFRDTPRVSGLPFHINPITGVISTKSALDRESNNLYSFIATSRDTTNSRLSSTAEVEVVVLDKNDHVPTFTFPSKVNDTVRLSIDAPKGYTVARLIVDDADVDNNSKLVFTLTTNDHGLFEVDPEYGLVKMASPVPVATPLNTVFNLGLMVRDCGIPVLKSSGLLNIVVVPGYVLYGETAVKPNTSSMAEDNFVIVVILAAVSGVIMIILIMAIVYICIYNRRKRRHSANQGFYNCRKNEALRKKCTNNRSNASDERTLTEDMSLENTSGMRAKHTAGYAHEQDQSSIVARPKSQMSIPSVTENGIMQLPVAHSSEKTYTKILPDVTLPMSVQGQRGVVPNGNCSILSQNGDMRASELHGSPSVQNSKSQNMARVAWRLRHSGGVDDMESGDSDPDSGKGPSEEGDAQHMHDLLSKAGLQPTPPISDESGLQIVPQLMPAKMSTFSSASLDRNKKNTTSRSPEPKLITIRKRPEGKSVLAVPPSVKALTADPWIRRGYDGDTYSSTSPRPSKEHYHRASLFNSPGSTESPCESLDTTKLSYTTAPNDTMSPTVRVKLKKKYPLEDIQASYLDYCHKGSDPCLVHNTSSRDSPRHASGEADSLATTSGNESNSLMYSCADVSVVLRSKTPDSAARQTDCIPEEEEDVASSTSGSYVVGAEELCEKIEQLFLKQVKV